MYFFFFFNDTATTEIYTLSLHDALPISYPGRASGAERHGDGRASRDLVRRSEEHTSELQSLRHLVCRLLLEKKKKIDLAEHDRTVVHIATHIEADISSLGVKIKCLH